MRVVGVYCQIHSQIGISFTHHFCRPLSHFHILFLNFYQSAM